MKALMDKPVEVQIGIGDTVMNIPAAYIRSVEINQTYEDIEVTTLRSRINEFIHQPRPIEFSITGLATENFWKLADAIPKTKLPSENPCAFCLSHPFTESAFRPGTCANCGGPRGA